MIDALSLEKPLKSKARSISGNRMGLKIIDPLRCQQSVVGRNGDKCPRIIVKEPTDFFAFSFEPINVQRPSCVHLQSGSAEYASLKEFREQAPQQGRLQYSAQLKR